MNRVLYLAALLLGAAAVVWVGAGYIGSNPLALTMTILIGTFYAMGAFELQRFQQATRALDQALASIPAKLPSLGTWLDKLPPALQNPVRLRVEGERVGLPGPAMTPYLVGLLVLLGMLGTFLGMVVTLKGAVIALESTTDLQAVRAALAAPVKGLGVAFGTSVAGVSASAMLGLLSALCRRERLQAAQVLDTRIATSLRVFSRAHQREEGFRQQQAQAELMPKVVDQLQALMAQLERQNLALNERLVAGQAHFHAQAETVYSNLATSVGKSLQKSLTESARAAGATIQPVVEATMASIARETTSLHERMAGTVQQQLDGFATRFDGTVTGVAQGWTSALDQHRRSSDDLAQGLRETLAGFGESFEQRSASLLATVEDAHRGLQREVAEAVTLQLNGVAEHFDGTVTTVSGLWQDALAQHQRTSDKLAGDTQSSLAAVAQTFEQHAAALGITVDQAHRALQTELVSRDEQRLAAWRESLEAMALQLQQGWQQAGAASLDQQERICATLQQTAEDISAKAEAHARNTIAEMAQLMQAAAEAPRAAADVIGQLRQKLSDSIARDNELLDERSRIMATLGSLLDGINHASNEQRVAIDALVASSADVLERVGTRFTENVEAETGKISLIAAQVTGGAAEVASLGEAFGFGVQRFSESNEQLMAQLQRIEASLGKSTARSDEQLAYYVAQARELIDLSITSQKAIVEDLQRLAIRQPAAVATEAA